MYSYIQTKILEYRFELGNKRRHCEKCTEKHNQEESLTHYVEYDSKQCGCVHAIRLGGVLPPIFPRHTNCHLTENKVSNQESKSYTCL